MNEHKPNTSRQRHRLATDSAGNKYLVTAMSNEKNGTVSIRIWSKDGKAPTTCFYFPAGPAKDMPVTTLAKEVGILVESEDYNKITGDSTNWDNLHLMRKLKVVASKTKQVGTEWINVTVYRHCWFKWEQEVSSAPCITKSIANHEGALAAFDKAFPSCARLLSESAADKRSANMIEW
jgi:hypothetical protein